MKKPRPQKSIVHHIRRDLESADAAKRVEAVEALAIIRDLRGLFLALRSRDAYLRCVSLHALAGEPGEQLAWRLAHRTHDRDELVRRHAAYVLGQRPEWIARFALRWLIAGDRSHAVRCEALAAYAAAAPHNAVAVLTTAAEKDPDPAVREQALALLAHRSTTLSRSRTPSAARSTEGRRRKGNHS